MAMEDVGGNLTKKMGPFPVWVWGVLIGGAFVVWYWVSQRDAGSSAVADSVAEGDLTTEAPPSGDFSTVPVMPPSDGVVDEATNLEWSIQAVNALTGTGTSLLAAQSAISKYLNSETLSSAERTIIDRILTKIGPPPEGVYTPTPPPAEAEPTNATTTTLTAPTTRKFGQAASIRVKTRWVTQTGHVGNPSGTVTFYVDGAKRSAVPLINGEAVYVTVPVKGWDSTADKKWIITARFTPLPGSKAVGSQATPHVITLTTT